MVASFCGCRRTPRRRCDICASANLYSVVCSLGCLRQHLHDAHGQVSEDASIRARLSLRDLNARYPDDWDRYAPHRFRTTEVVTDVAGRAGTGDLCVFGAGNCADVDLQALSHRFGEIHLVDLDEAALERARARQPEAVRDRIVLHPNIDLSGFLGQIDEWGESFPDPSELNTKAVAAARNIIARLGRTFEVTLSCCVLSQLVTPYHRALALPQVQWANLVGALRAVHLATVAGSTARGGAGALTFDVLSSTDAPKLAALHRPDRDTLSSFVAHQLHTDPGSLDPEPETFRVQFFQGLSALVKSPRLTQPWLWDINGAVQLVYGLTFQRV